MRGLVPGDPASLSAAGTAARRASRELESAHERGATAYTSLGKVWGTSTSVRTRKEGHRAMAALTKGAQHAEAVGEAVQAYAVELSDLQARGRRLLEAAAAAGVVVEEGRVRLAWGVSGEADPRSVDEQEARLRELQAELDALTAQHRRRRDRLVTLLGHSTHDLAMLANGLRLG